MRRMGRRAEAEETDEDDEYAAYCRIAKACYCHFKSLICVALYLLRDKRVLQARYLVLYDELSITVFIK